MVMIRKMIALDWRAMKYNWTNIYLIPIMVLLMGIFSPLFIIPMSVFCFLGFSTSTFFAEVKGELNYLYLAMPIRRADVVKGRFVFSFIMVVIGLVVGIVMKHLVNFASLNLGITFLGLAVLELNQYLALLAISFFIYAFFSLFMFPFLFMLGYEKGKYFGTYLPIIIAVVSPIVYTIIVNHFELQQADFMSVLMGYVAENLSTAAIGTMVLAIIILLFSYMVSVRIYEKRDF
jgi:hypothetical protein